MKRLIFLATLLLAAAPSSFATLVTINSGVVDQYHGTFACAYARLEADREFSTSEGVRIAAGSGFNGFGRQFTCSVDGSGNITIATGTAYSTDDSSNPSAKYTLALYDTFGHMIRRLFQDHGLKISHTISPTTWDAIRSYTEGNPTVTLSSMDIVDQHIASAVTAASSGKQDALVNQTNIKSVSNHSLVGAGNVALVGSDVAVDPNVGLPGVTNVQQNLDSLYTRSAPELPSQSTHGGQYLTTDGASTSWAAVGGGGGGGGTTTVYNVMTYGAVGDGSHDDTAAFQAAVSAACIAGNGTVFFPAPPAPVPTHFWIWSSPIYIPQGCTGLRIVGVGGYALDSQSETDPVVYTGTVGPAIRVNQTNGLYVGNIDWRYSNASFTGDLFNLDASSTVVATFTRSSGNIFSTATTAGVYTGSKTTVATSGSLPTGLAGLTTYYIIKLSSTTFSLATSYANAVAGTAITISSAGTGTQTMTAGEDGNVTLATEFRNNSFKSFGAARAAGAGSARSHINLAGSITTSIIHNSFEFAKYGVIGFTSTDRNNFATTVTFSRNFHRNATIAAIANHDQAWNVNNDIFEYIYPLSGSDGPAGGYINAVEGTARSAYGLTFAGCWFGDTGSEGGTWIIYDGSVLTVRDSWVNLGTAATFVSSPNSGQNYVFHGNDLVYGGSGTVYAFKNTGGVHTGVVFDSDENFIQNGITKFSGAVGIGGTDYTIGSDVTSHANSSGTFQNLVVITAPANIFSNLNETEEFEAFGTYAANGNNKEITLDDTSTEFTSGVLTDNGGSWKLEVQLVYSSSTTAEAYFKFTHNGAIVTGYKHFSSVGLWTSGIPWAIKVQGTAANDIVCNVYRIRKRRG